MYKIKTNKAGIIEMRDEKTGVVLFIRKSDSTLLNLINTSDNVVDVCIPYEFPSGQKIKALNEEFAYGEPGSKGFNKVTVSKGIKIENYAFQGALINEVVWPDDVFYIPTGCFLRAKISTISNIDEVDEIGEAAFLESKIQKIVWPDNCFSISSSCFEFSKIKEISNINHVTTIHSNAFANTEIKEFTWPSKCKVIPPECFAGSLLECIYNIQGVRRISRDAFYDSSLKCLDLSNNFFVNLEIYSLRHLPEECQVIPPYYASEKEYMAALGQIKKM